MINNGFLIAGIIILIGAIVLTAFITINYQQDIQQAYNRLEGFQPKAEMTEFGRISYLDDGVG